MVNLHPTRAWTRAHKYIPHYEEVEHELGSNCRKLVSGKVKEQRGKLTDDDLDVIEVKQDQFIGRLEGRYAYSKDQAEQELKSWKVT